MMEKMKALQPKCFHPKCDNQVNNALVFLEIVMTCESLERKKTNNWLPPSDGSGSSFRWTSTFSVTARAHSMSSRLVKLSEGVICKAPAFWTRKMHPCPSSCTRDLIWKPIWKTSSVTIHYADSLSSQREIWIT